MDTITIIKTQIQQIQQMNKMKVNNKEVDMNRVFLMGRITHDLELKQSNNTSYINFNIAVSRGYNKDITDFLSCTAFNKTAEFMSKYFHKGNLIAIEGSIQNNKYTDNAGNERTTNKIIVSNVYFTGDKNDNNNNNFKQINTNQFEELEYDENELPF